MNNLGCYLSKIDTAQWLITQEVELDTPTNCFSLLYEIILIILSSTPSVLKNHELRQHV